MLNKSVVLKLKVELNEYNLLTVNNSFILKCLLISIELVI